ncbi:PREDICTED: protein SERAC1 isoform X2 [Acromyrmex echinatior]|uniref:protein SERAC1 isoform X2 n=1 Tax=Acromyrmex echinatior TaxID=103372 RepID=UPI0005810881|nr:PREDICTED: protein SERAC1 isoform X2 [Acromyrmex echinatior]
MRARVTRNYVYYLKTSSTCVVVLGGCWFLYQLRQVSQIIRSAVNTSVLNLEQTRAQYIYIDDPRFKDIFMFRKDEDLHGPTSEKPTSLSDALAKWWNMKNHKIAYKLLYMAQHGNKNERYKAVTTLGSLSHLKDWQYRHLAQMMDAKTAVALARMPNVNSLFFLQPPYYHVQYNLDDVLEKIHSLLLNLNALCDNTHLCLTQFLSKMFKNSHRYLVEWFDYDLTSVGLFVETTTVRDDELLKSCIHAICHHSSVEQYSKHLINAGALPILTAIQKICNDDIEICILLARILSNISLHSEYLETIYESGWIGILSHWSHSDDIRLSAQAISALVNLDTNENEKEKYPQNVYLLHPLHRIHAAIKMDVIFLHGLLGGVFVTWRQRDIDTSALGVVDDNILVENTTDYLSAMVDDDRPQEFFKDLARDLHLREWRKIGQDFEVILDDCPQNTNDCACGPYFCRGDDTCMRNLDFTSKTLCWPKDWLPVDIPSLRIIGINYGTSLSMWTPFCPIESMKSTIKERSEEFITKLTMANVGQRPLIWVAHSMGGLLIKKMLVEEWKTGDKNGICKNTKAILFYGTPHRGSHVAALKQTTQMLLWPTVEVQELREDPGVGEFFEIPQDHLSICKPASRQSFLYQKLLSVLRRHVNTQEDTSVSIRNLLSLLSKLF